MYTIQQTAEILKLSRQRVYKLIHATRLDAMVIPGGRYKSYRVSEEAIQKYLESKKQPES